MDPHKHFSSYNLKNGGRKQKFGHTKNMQSGWGIFTLYTVSDVTADFEKVVSDLLHAGCTWLRKRMYQEKSEAIRIAQKNNNNLKPFHMRYKRTLQCTNLILHANTQ